MSWTSVISWLFSIIILPVGYVRLSSENQRRNTRFRR